MRKPVKTQTVAERSGGMKEEFDYIGKRIPRIESRGKVTGSVKYVSDMMLPGMVYARFLRSPHAHAKVISVDTSRAEKLPGVKLVLTPDDVVGKINPHGITHPKHQYPLHQEVMYVGDEVAAVAAVDAETAEEALGLIEVEYEELPAVFDPEEAMGPGAPQLHEEAGNVRDQSRVRIGNIEDGFREADHIVKGKFETSKQVHVTLETHGCLSSYNPADGKLTHWTPTQQVLYTQLDIADALDMPASKIRVINPEGIGGGFGSRVGTFAYDVCAALMSIKLGKPVKMILNREEEFMATRSRHPFTREVEVGLKKDGTIVGWRGKAISDMGGYADWGPCVTRLSNAVAPGPYKIPNIWIDAYPVYTNKSISGAFRGFGATQSNFARESLLDIAADQIGMDPLELRLKNVIKPDDLPYTTSTGFVVRSCGVEECLKKAAEAIGWSKKRKPYTGVGMASIIAWGAIRLIGLEEDFSSAEVEVSPDGSLIVRTGNVDVGQGLYTTLAQVAAEELGIPLEKVTIIGADSGATPPDLGCWASRSAVTTGSAVKKAAAAAKEKLFRIAGKMLEVETGDLIARHGNIYIKDLNKAVTIKDVASAAYFTTIDGGDGPVIGQGVWSSPTTPLNEDGYGDCAPAYTFAANAAEVEVDPETGQMKLTKYVTAHDVGRALNEITVEGQLQGGVSQAVGYGMFEDGLLYDNETGQLLNPSIMDYKVPTAVDLPEIQPIIVETIDPDTLMGQKGLGDVSIHLGAPAVANAVFDAVGVRISDLPVTPVKILRALKEKEGRT